MKNIKLKRIISESSLGISTGNAPDDGEHGNSTKFSTEAKKNFLEIVSTYGKYQEMMDRKSDIAQIAETLGAITEAATKLAISEGEDWFDKHTIKRNMGELKKLGEQFDKVAKEAASLDQRLNGLYEDMGHILSRYYKVGDITEEEMKTRLGMTNESNGDDIKKGDIVYVNYPTLTKPFKAKVTNIINSPEGKLLVLGNHGVWDSKWVSRYLQSKREGTVTESKTNCGCKKK